MVHKATGSHIGCIILHSLPHPDGLGTRCHTEVYTAPIVAVREQRSTTRHSHRHTAAQRHAWAQPCHSFQHLGQEPTQFLPVTLGYSVKVSQGLCHRPRVSQSLWTPPATQHKRYHTDKKLLGCPVQTLGATLPCFTGHPVPRVGAGLLLTDWVTPAGSACVASCKWGASNL